MATVDSTAVRTKLILPYLRLAVEKEASDLFFSAGAAVAMKVEGTTMAVGRAPLTGDQAKELVWSVLTEQQRNTLKEKWELDFAIDLPDLGRFRVNAFHQRGKHAMCLRRGPGRGARRGHPRPPRG